MKVLYKNAQIISLLLSFLFLFQNCHVYHKVPISLDEAVAADKRMKVISTDGEKYKFRKIEKKDSIYYGLTKIKDQKVKVPLKIEKIKSIHPVNKATSTALSVGIAVAVPIAILYAIAYSMRDELVEIPTY